MRKPLVTEQEKKLTRIFQECLGHPLRISFEYVTEIKRTPNRKYEDFRSEIT